MATRRVPSRPQTRKNRSGNGGPSNLAYGVPVPESLHEAIESEREQLSKAESVLGCLVTSMEGDESDYTGGPYYPDVARIARDLVRQSINALDSLALQKRILRNRIKEESADCSYWGGGMVGRALLVDLRC